MDLALAAHLLSFTFHTLDPFYFDVMVVVMENFLPRVKRLLRGLKI